MDVQTIIYAPNGKVTLNVSTGTLHGRIFAKNIEIVSDSFEILAEQRIFHILVLFTLRIQIPSQHLTIPV